MRSRVPIVCGCARLRSIRDNAVFLIGCAENQAIYQSTLVVAYQAITLVDGLLLRAPVTAHCHPASIDDRPSALGLVPDNSRQH
jgi:hypothetical protein